jgi:hypothetical protein
MSKEALNKQLLDRLEELMDHFGAELYISSKTYGGECPIHGGDNPTALQIYHDGPHPGKWFCFTHHCEQTFGGDLIGLARGFLSQDECNWQYDGDPMVSFNRTIQFIEDFLGEEVDPERPVRKNLYKTFIQPESVNKKPAITRSDIQKTLRIPSSYYLGRGYHPEILRQHDIGDCLTAGKPMFYRAVVPIYDSNGDYVGCTGRSLYDKPCPECKAHHNPRKPCPEPERRRFFPKWRHSTGLKTSEVLYNMNQARKVIQMTGVACIVESPGNVLRLREAGIHNAVALLGTSMSPVQKNILDSSGALSLILLMDNDENNAGEEATKKLTKQCQNTHTLYCPDFPGNDIGDLSIEQINETIRPVVEQAIRTIGIFEGVLA